MAEFAKAGDFCPNPDCPDYEQAQKSCGNIIKFGHTRSGRQRYKCKTCNGTELKAIYGDLEELVELLGKSTAYVERTHLTMRTFSSRLTRKSIAFSKEIGIHKACAAIEDMYCNLIRPHKTLRLKNEDGGGKNGKNGLPQWRQG